MAEASGWELSSLILTPTWAFEIENEKFRVKNSMSAFLMAVCMIVVV
jgi:ABC-type transport system involved in cytochrome c biogenesis permease subunit